jgi:DNA-binding transcriptional ArsR family regulator
MLSESDERSGELSSRFELSQPAISRHLRILRESGLVKVRTDGQLRIYSLEVGPLIEFDAWLSHYRALWAQRLDALGNELKRNTKNLPSPESESAKSSTNEKEAK